MRFGKGYVARMVEYSLVAGKGARLGKTGGTTGNIRCRLIVTKTREGVIVVRKIVVYAAIEFALVLFANGLAGIVVVQGCIVRIGQRIEIDQLLADWIDVGRRNDVAIGTDYWGG